MHDLSPLRPLRRRAIAAALLALGALLPAPRLVRGDDLLVDLGPSADWSSVRGYAGDIADVQGYFDVGINSSGEPGERDFDDQRVTTRFAPAADGVRVAAFSDDGVDVAVTDLTAGTLPEQVLGNRGTDQALGRLGESLHELDYEFREGHDYEIAVDYLNTLYTGGGDVDGAVLIAYGGAVVDDPDWCDDVCGEEWEWNHGIPKAEGTCVMGLVDAHNALVDAGSRPAPKIEKHDAKWGHYLRKKCHRRKPNGIHTRGPGGNWVTWEDAWRIWCEEWKKQKVGPPTESDFMKAYNAFREDEPGKADPPIDRTTGLGKAPNGKAIEWPQDKFKDCFAKGCPATMRYPKWEKIDPKDEQVRADCCPAHPPCPKTE